MHQPSLFEPNRQDSDQPPRTVNVASVPQRSPFRYPGGKTWLVPLIRRWLASRPRPPAEFIEPFAGGAIVSLTVAFERRARHVTMIERDEEVAAVWRTIVDGDADWLAERIATFELSPESVRAVLDGSPTTREEIAFRTILKNRVYHGGILAPGSGLIKYGEGGRGLKSRWYPATLKRRILDIALVRDRLTFLEGDGMAILRQHAHQPHALFFIVPPYTAGGKKAGARLYTYFELDHEELFRI